MRIFFAPFTSPLSPLSEVMSDNDRLEVTGLGKRFQHAGAAAESRAESADRAGDGDRYRVSDSRGDIANALGVTSPPTTIVIDREGLVSSVIYGATTASALGEAVAEATA